MKPQINIDEPGTAWPQPKNKKKSPRTHLSQVWSPAFRLPWVRSRLKPELRTSPQRRGERRRSSLGAHASSVLTVSRLLPEHARCVRSQENARKSFLFCQRISSRLRVFVVRFFWLRLCCSVFICVHPWFRFVRSLGGER